jgi:hypothetical protein
MILHQPEIPFYSREYDGVDPVVFFNDLALQPFFMILTDAWFVIQLYLFISPYHCALIS